ncbi:MAG: HEXXH motif-containing putative peptide modification protein [Novosphingobium sp.]
MDAAVIDSIHQVLADRLPEGRGRAASVLGAQGPLRALDYGAYFDVAVDKLNGVADPDVVSDAARYLTERIGAIRDDDPVRPDDGTGTDQPRVTTLSADYYTQAEIDRLKRWWDAEADNGLDLTGLSAADLAAAKRNLAHCLELLERCAPELYGETLEVLGEIVFARPNGGQRLELAGASSFALWGAAVINAEIQGWPLQFQTLVHEAAHNLLFAVARNEPLVLNDIEERVFSPLRNEERPIDGVYHAAFVSARECLALDRLLCWHEEEDALSAEEAETVELLLNGSAIAFWQCAQPLRSHARLSPLGDAILGECETYMSKNFVVETN